MTESESGEQVQSVRRLITLLAALSDRKKAGITELSDETGLAKSTIHRYLATLYDLGYVDRDGREYFVSLRFLKIGENARNRERAFQLAAGKVEQLAEETNERCQFVVEEHGRGVYCHVATGNNAVVTDSHLGNRLFLHSTSVGKAIMAYMTEAEVEAVIDTWGLPALTESTITSRDELFEELEAIKERGIAFNKNGNINGLNSVGAPVFDGSGETIGALSVSGPAHRMKGAWFEQEIPDLLLGATNELLLKLEYQDAVP